MQKLQRLPQAQQRPRPRRQRGQRRGRQRFCQVGARQAALHGAAQIGLRQAGHRGVHGRQAGRQLAAGQLEAGVHHFARQKTAAQLAAHTHARAHGKGFLVRRVKIEKAQHAAVAAVVHLHAQLPARLESDFAMRHLSFDLHHIAVTRIGQPGDAGFVLVAQRQVQRQIDRARQSQLIEQFLRLRLLRRLGLGAGGRVGQDGGHALIVPLRVRLPPCQNRCATYFFSTTWNGPVRPSSA